MDPETPLDPWAAVVGQPWAVQQLQSMVSAPLHAYLFVGPRGAGKRAAVRAFAAAVLSTGLDPAAATRTTGLALAEQHPDLVVVEPDGLIFRFPNDGSDSPGSRLVREINSSPVESDRKIVVAVDFHTADPEIAVGKLLKSIEEPPPRTIAILLEEEVPPEQATIESRCSRIDFGPVPAAAVREHLVSRGVDAAVAEMAAEVATGDVGRAELLAGDPELKARFDSWRSMPTRLDGRGATVAALAAEIDQRLEAAQQPLSARHTEQLQAFEEEAEHLGLRVGARKALVDQQKREVRQLRTDELRFGMATIAGPYREQLAVSDRPERLVASLDAIQRAAEAFERNPIESLLIETLLLDLDPLRA